MQSSIVVTKTLGHGATATVYKAYEEVTTSSTRGIPSNINTVAIKVFDHDSLTLAQLTQTDIDIEVQVHRDLVGHPHIVPLLDYKQSTNGVKIRYEGSDESIEGESVMILEYCRYGDLFDFVDANYGDSLEDEKLLKFIFLQVCKGLHALHT